MHLCTFAHNHENEVINKWKLVLISTHTLTHLGQLILAGVQDELILYKNKLK
jgi:hypothetical protein